MIKYTLIIFLITTSTLATEGLKQIFFEINNDCQKNITISSKSFQIIYDTTNFNFDNSFGNIKKKFHTTTNSDTTSISLLIGELKNDFIINTMPDTTFYEIHCMNSRIMIQRNPTTTIYE